ncbi:SdpA family antimicrobial peptide system protein [Quadrisphaera setariae]|uniref:SdpA family antimicrobial peptide system protein n=1 Tax=Quadrisphaera setariae TaxID=2593304 RepID=UPI001C9C6A19|nr:SdpA family antimicrobial peptide system protein [Quadrisphaera setariae]
MGIALLLSVFFTLPSNVLSSRDGGTWRSVFATIAPQNWSFFTRDPESAEIVAYQGEVTAKEPQSLMKTPQAKASNFFGITRTQRAQGVEIGLLSSEVTSWADCTDRAAICLKAASQQKVEQAENTSPAPTLCGNIILTQQRVTPWSYRNLYPDALRIEKVEHLQVRCDHQS